MAGHYIMHANTIYSNRVKLSVYIITFIPERYLTS